MATVHMPTQYLISTAWGFRHTMESTRMELQNMANIATVTQNMVAIGSHTSMEWVGQQDHHLQHQLQPQEISTLVP